MYNKQELGRLGEDLAYNYYEKNGYKLIERNFRCKQGEVDIITYDLKSKELVFCEVKTRTSFNYGLPSEAVNNVKLKHIVNTANYYLYSKGINKISVRIDVIEIVLNHNKYKLNHLKNVL